MAVRYPIISGNWSNALIWNGGTLPTSADDVYANGFTVTIDQNITVLSLRNTAQSPAVAGGGFLLSGTYTINATSAAGLTAGNAILLTYTGTGSVINATINGSLTTNINTIRHNSTGNLTINGDVLNTVTTSIDVITTTSTGTLNINGNILGNGRGNNIVISSICTVNIVGNVTRNSAFSGGSCISITSQSTLNITGIVSGVSAGSGSPTISINSNLSVVNITGSVFHNTTNSQNFVIQINQAATVIIVGSVYNLQPLSLTISSTVNSYLKITGPIYTTTTTAAVSSTNSTAINIFSGPFISSDSGAVPFVVARMHYIQTIGSYFEFRDSSTNGALPPATPAPATRLVSPDTVVDSPIPSNVRNGVSYALGTFTGTLKVPNPNSVAFGVETDNTVGNAVLTPNAVWNHLTANITTAESIGERLKNASTVDTTGDQLAALL